ncbi:hypothetical protein IEQ34_009689 [Dendrobium chrysotoxum]|uniref:Uncharacterized protein n=1 Tax=Dendrobium chrysotoxum TaxID=161865 RepID=A0AAV7H238_DENCH|nr:hypothetical protein IEQ34_009689 [Dendrobium chrysotoxum]
MKASLFPLEISRNSLALNLGNSHRAGCHLHLSYSPFFPYLPQFLDSGNDLHVWLVYPWLLPVSLTQVPLERSHPGFQPPDQNHIKTTIR